MSLCIEVDIARQVVLSIGDDSIQQISQFVTLQPVQQRIVDVRRTVEAPELLDVDHSGDRLGAIATGGI